MEGISKVQNVKVLKVVVGKQRTLLVLSIPTKGNEQVGVNKKDVVTVEISTIETPNVETPNVESVEQ